MSISTCNLKRKMNTQHILLFSTCKTKYLGSEEPYTIILYWPFKVATGYITISIYTYPRYNDVFFRVTVPSKSPQNSWHYRHIRTLGIGQLISGYTVSSGQKCVYNIYKNIISWYHSNELDDWAWLAHKQNLRIETECGVSLLPKRTIVSHCNRVWSVFTPKKNHCIAL